MPKIFLIKNRLHQQQLRLLESQNLLAAKDGLALGDRDADDRNSSPSRDGQHEPLSLVSRHRDRDAGKFYSGSGRSGSELRSADNRHTRDEPKRRDRTKRRASRNVMKPETVELFRQWAANAIGSKQFRQLVTQRPAKKERSESDT